ncbi:hypothetical protein BKA69DRAFT_261503 [Paraphysoderma sedebokerense]|nr:hypothetical protein BKA69DRAFT_261503 [Paraphysoderma sedebokerense]
MSSDSSCSSGDDVVKTSNGGKMVKIQNSKRGQDSLFDAWMNAKNDTEDALNETDKTSTLNGNQPSSSLPESGNGRLKSSIDQRSQKSPYPLLDQYLTKDLLNKLSFERNWTPSEVENDWEILNKHRLRTVSDLRSLSAESWTQIQADGLLPLVRDLLRIEVYKGLKTETSIKQGKKLKKKQKKMMKAMNNQELKISKMEKTKPDNDESSITSDSECMSDSAINSNSKENLQPSNLNSQSQQKPALDPTNPTALVQSLLFGESMISKTLQNTSDSSSSPRIILGPLPNNPSRMNVQTSSGKVFETDRYCPHKKYDMVNAPVVGNKLICPKHDWEFDLERGGICVNKRNGKGVNSCAVSKELQW